MLLTDIKKYLSAKKEATLDELSRHLKTDPVLVEQGAQHWIAKGKLEREAHKVPCSGCSCGCGNDHADHKVLITYKWTG